MGGGVQKKKKIELWWQINSFKQKQNKQFEKGETILKGFKKLVVTPVHA